MRCATRVAPSAPSPSPRKAVATHSASRRSGAARILIVEDEVLIAMECEWILSNAGYEVVGTAADEHQALSLAERARPDLMLMDVRLARGGDGIEVAKSIRSRFGIRSLFVSAHGDRETRSRSRGIDHLGWLVKPYTAGMLLDAVDEALVCLGSNKSRNEPAPRAP